MNRQVLQVLNRCHRQPHSLRSIHNDVAGAGMIRLSSPRRTIPYPNGMWSEWWPYDPPVERTSTNAYLTRLDGKKWYFLCQCGRSKSQPFCDGSHKGTMMRPYAIPGNISRFRLFCGCKAEYGNIQYCHGTCISLNFYGALHERAQRGGTKL